MRPEGDCPEDILLRRCLQPESSCAAASAVGRRVRPHRSPTAHARRRMQPPAGSRGGAPGNDAKMFMNHEKQATNFVCICNLLNV